MQKLIAVALLVIPLYGCQSILNLAAPPGEMGSNGKVNKCNDYRTNPQACGEARYNAPRVARVNIGQSLAEVRQIIGRDPETRSIKTEGGEPVEIWGFLTNYDKSITSLITFKSGKVVSVQATQQQ